MAASVHAHRGGVPRQRRRRDRNGHDDEPMAIPIKPGLVLPHSIPFLQNDLTAGNGFHSTTAFASAKAGPGFEGYPTWAQQNWHASTELDDWNGLGQGPRIDAYTPGLVPPAPPKPSPEPASHEPTCLKDLLLQVAPQARIADSSSSQLSSKASEKILSKVLEAAKTPQDPEAWLAGDATQSQDAVSTAASDALPATRRAGRNEDEDDETAFMQKWSGLFSKGSPLVEGSLEDPFEDVKKRAKVVWKKNDDRRGHRQRYQERKKEREKALEAAEGGSQAEVVYDASRAWYPQRAPAYANASDQWWS